MPSNTNAFEMVLKNRMTYPLQQNGSLLYFYWKYGIWDEIGNKVGKNRKNSLKRQKKSKKKMYYK